MHAGGAPSAKEKDRYCPQNAGRDANADKGAKQNVRHRPARLAGAKWGRSRARGRDTKRR